MSIVAERYGGGGWPGVIERLRNWARAVKVDVIALWLAARDRRTPWYARLLAVLVAAYAISPIDLIPDAVPVIGLLDDLIIVPLGIVAVVALIPSELMTELRAEAARIVERPVSRAAAAVIVAIWLAVAVWLGWLLWPLLQR